MINKAVSVFVKAEIYTYSYADSSQGTYSHRFSVPKANKWGYCPVASTFSGGARTVTSLAYTIVGLAKYAFSRNQHDLDDVKIGARKVVRGVVEMIPVIGNIATFVHDFWKKAKAREISESTTESTFMMFVGDQLYKKRLLNGVETRYRQKVKGELQTLPERCLKSFALATGEAPPHVTDFKVKTESTGFKIGGTNETALIQSLTSLNQEPINELEERLRPSKKDDFHSIDGFIGKNENLLDVLAKDNNFVRKNELTHSQLAYPLLHALKVALDNAATIRAPKTFEYLGCTYQTMCLPGTKGMQWSPFKDKCTGGGAFAVVNLDTQKILTFHDLVPKLILRYGFYEGEGTPYRIAPKEIIECFQMNDAARLGML